MSRYASAVASINVSGSKFHIGVSSGGLIVINKVIMLKHSRDNHIKYQVTSLRFILLDSICRLGSCRLLLLSTSP